jgi:anti-sigma-K factor RskA
LPRLSFWRVVLIVLAIVVAATVLLLLPFDLGSQAPIPREEIVDPEIR